VGALVGLEALVGWIFGLAKLLGLGGSFGLWELLVWVSLDGNFG